MQGKFGMGEAKFLDTPLGKIGKALVKDKVILGVSTRGIGTADNETGRVNDDYSLVTVDCVYDPSATGTLVESIVEGSEKWLFDNKTGEWVEKAVSNMKSQVAKKYDSKVAAKVFNEFIETLKNGYVK